jgi:hypothetical protein
MTFTRNLDWSLHINNNMMKSYQRINLLWLISRIVPLSTLIVLYFSMIRSVLDYGCEVYWSLSTANSEKLEQLQYKVGLIVTGAIQLTSYEKIIVELGWKTLSERRIFFKANLVYNIVHGLSPIYLQSLILTIQPERQFHLDLRNADHLTVPRCR